MTMRDLSARSARILLSLGVLALGIGIGTMLRPSDAKAGSLQSSVVVPREGLAFRSTDGRVIARLSAGPGGGVFELYDADERPSTAVRAGSIAPPRSITAWSPGSADESLVDPWTASSPNVDRLPASGL
jgi:hypothetical protein